MSKIKGISHIVLYVNDLDKWSLFIVTFSAWSNIARMPDGWFFLRRTPSLMIIRSRSPRDARAAPKSIGHIAWKVEHPADVKE